MVLTKKPDRNITQTLPAFPYYGFLFLILVAAGLLSYGLTLNSFFLGDDYFLLHQSTLGWSPLAHADFGFYRPLGLLSWFADFQLWHLQPLFYHSTNLLLHLVNCLLVAIVVDALASNRSYGRLAALLFCVYPGHPEAVTWLAGRFDLLATTGELLSFIFLIKFHFYFKHKYTTSGWLIASLLCYFLALLCKEAALFFPVFVGLYLLLEIFLSPEKSKVNIPVVIGLNLAVTGFYLILRFAVLGGFGSYDNADYNFLSFFWWATPQAFAVLIAPVNVVTNHQTVVPLLITSCHLLFWGSLLFIIFRLLIAQSGWGGERNSPQKGKLKGRTFPELQLPPILSSQPLTVSKTPRLLLILMTSLLWSLLAIQPALTIPYIRAGWSVGDLEGSRVLYAASIGVCLPVAIAVIEASACVYRKAQGWNRIGGFLALLVTVTMITSIVMIYLIALQLNNLAWRSAGEQASQIEQQFAQVVKVSASYGDNLKLAQPGVGIVLEGLPDNYEGAYIARNMFDFQDYLGEVFYGLKVPSGEIKPGQAEPDYTKIDFKRLYILHFSHEKNQIKLQSIEELDKPPK